MKPNLKIGDTFFYRLQYSTFREVKIYGETSRSWLVASPNNSFAAECPERGCTKFPKSGKDYIFGTAEDAALHTWAIDNRWKIGGQVDRLYDEKIILAIAKLIGYENLPETK